MRKREPVYWQTSMAKDTTGRLHVTVKTGGKRKLSSKLWLERQLNDPYVAQAKREGYRSRAAYKLIEIDDKYHFLKPGLTVVDLGAAPGGWSQIAAKRVGVASGKGKVLAIDLLEMPEIVGVTFAQLDFLADDTPARLLAMMDGRADVVMSDMAANTTGHRKTDQLRMIGLVEAAAAFAAEVLKPGGTFLAKTFQSGADAELMTQLKRDFASVRHVKPASSRQDFFGALRAGHGISRCPQAASPGMTMIEQPKWTTSIDELVRAFRDAMCTMVPIAERVHIPWKEPDAYDDWDQICDAIFRSIVINSIKHTRGLGASAPIVPYDRRISSYKENSFIGNLCSKGRSAFLCFETDVSPFDQSLFARLDSDFAVVEYGRIPTEEVKFIFCSQDRGAGNVIFHDTIDVRI